jgi:hypothetical protein
MHRASAALRYAAAVLGAGQPQNIAQHPEQGHICGGIDRPLFIVYSQVDHEIPRARKVML